MSLIPGLAMFKTPLNFMTLVPGSAVVLACVGVVWAVYDAGYDRGSAHVQNKWNVEKLSKSEEINRLNARIGRMETAHNLDTVRITDELFKANAAYTSAVADLNARYVARLLDSEKRATIYQRMSEAGPVEQQRLASHAAKLDGSIEEGRRVVEELRSVVVQCERRLTLLGEQIKSDRKLMDNTDGK